MSSQTRQENGTAEAAQGARIREWARAHGYEVGARGRMPLRVVEAFHAAAVSEETAVSQRAGVPAVPHPYSPDTDEVPRVSSPQSSPAYTWRALLPWLDWLAPSELLAMQRLGGPAQWWLRETPHESSTRRADMEEVFELLGSFLESAPLDGEPLSSLLPALPTSKATAALGITAKARAALETTGGPTLGAVGGLTPRSILRTPLGSMQERRNVLAALVCEGVLLGAPAAEHTGQPERQTTPEPSVVEDPDNAVAGWFGRLDSRQQDLIVHHLCAEAPHSVEVLAVRHRTLRERMGQLLTDLSRNLQKEAAGRPGLGSAVAYFEASTREPVTRTDLADRLPWLRSRLVDWDVTVLDILAAVLLGVPTGGEWLFAGSLTRARMLTLEALAMDPGEHMSLTTAARLLDATGMPLKPTQAWLRSCGLDLVAGQVERAAGDPAVPRVDLKIAEPQRSGADRDYVLAPPVPTAEARPAQIPAAGAVAAEENEEGFESPESSAPTSAPTAAAELVHVLGELHAYAAEELPGGRLVDLLDGSAPSPGPVRRLVARLLSATPGTDGWVLPKEPPQVVHFAVAAGTDATASADPVDGPTDERVGLADKVAVVLAAARVPLTSSEVLAAVPEAGDLQRVVQILFLDPRTEITGSGGWTLLSRQEAPTGRAELSDHAAGAAQAAPGSAGGTLKERAWHVLNESGHPLATPVLAERIGGDVNLRSLKSQLPTDTRFMRSDADAWALTAWGLRAYTTIKELVAEEVDRADGEIPTTELVAILTRDFSIKESSLVQVASSPPFTSRGGVVRRLSDTWGSSRLSMGAPGAAGSASDGSDDEGPSTDDLIDLMGL